MWLNIISELLEQIQSSFEDREYQAKKMETVHSIMLRARIREQSTIWELSLVDKNIEQDTLYRRTYRKTLIIAYSRIDTRIGLSFYLSILFVIV